MSGTYDLRRFLRFAKRQLRLLDWNISVRWLQESEYEKFANPPGENPTPSKACTDTCDSAIDERRTDIRLLAGACHDQQEAENVLTHELLHLVLWHANNNRWRDTRLLEQAIVTLEEPVANGIRVAMKRHDSCKSSSDSRVEPTPEAKAA